MLQTAYALLHEFQSRGGLILILALWRIPLALVSCTFDRGGFDRIAREEIPHPPRFRWFQWRNPIRRAFTKFRLPCSLAAGFRIFQRNALDAHIRTHTWKDAGCRWRKNYWEQTSGEGLRSPSWDLNGETTRLPAADNCIDIDASILSRLSGALRNADGPWWAGGEWNSIAT